MNDGFVFFMVAICLLGISTPLIWSAPPHPDLIFKQDPLTGRMMLRSGIRLEDYLGLDPVRTTAVLQADGIEYVLVLRVDFSDQPGQRPTAEIDGYFFDPTDISLRSYYAENSYGQMRIEAGPVGKGLPTGDQDWYRAPKPMFYYGEGNYNLSRYRELVSAVCEMADADVDFSDYDRDGDGFVDHLVVVHSGNDQASTQVFDDIWSLLVTSVNRVFDGVFIDSAVLVAEEPDFPSPHLGIYFHEFFHDLGAPDMYGSNNIADAQDNRWCLMGMFGPYQGEDNNGLSPSHICGYLKWDFDGEPENGRHGWIVPNEIRQNQELVIPSFESPPGEDKLFRINLPGKDGKEFFLLENRYKDSGGFYDTGLPESGILIWHVDETLYRSAVDASNRIWVEDPSDPMHEIDVEQLTAGAAYSADDGQTAFTPSTLPNSNANDGTPTEISITDIGPEGPMMSLRIFFGDTYEPNEALENAFAIDYDRTYQSFIYSPDDVDIYRFQAVTNQPVIVTLTSIPERANYALALLDSTQTVIAVSNQGAAEMRQLVYKPRKDGWLYVLIESSYGFSTVDSYEIAVTQVNTAPGLLSFQDVFVTPNPIRAEHSTVRITFTIPGNRFAEQVTLGIYDVAGRLVYEDQILTALGSEVFQWDATDSQGKRLAAGIYAYILTGENENSSTHTKGLLAIER